jgi:hypothetical protein
MKLYLFRLLTLISGYVRRINTLEIIDRQKTKVASFVSSIDVANEHKL